MSYQIINLQGVRTLKVYFLSIFMKDLNNHGAQFCISAFIFLIRYLIGTNSRKVGSFNRTNSGQLLYESNFAGDYPDPYIFRDGDDFYMTHSLFEYYPGVLIWHSKDWCIGSRFAVRFIKIPICWVFVIPTTNNAKQTER